MAEFVRFVARHGVTRRQRERLGTAVSSPATLAELDVLRAVNKHGQVGVTTLADGMALDRTTVSRLIGQLEELGLVQRTKDSEDRRKTWIEVAPTGQELLSELDRVSLQDFQVATRQWSETDRRKLGRLLDRLRHDLAGLSFDPTGWAVDVTHDDSTTAG
jgi:DNA-binding MarR family transcriptional regulator